LVRRRGKDPLEQSPTNPGSPWGRERREWGQRREGNGKQNKELGTVTASDRKSEGGGTASSNSKQEKKRGGGGTEHEIQQATKKTR